MEFHRNEVQRVCRVCGKRLRKRDGKGQVYQTSDYTKELREVFSLEIECDIDSIHP